MRGLCWEHPGEGQGEAVLMPQPRGAPASITPRQRLPRVQAGPWTEDL